MCMSRSQKERVVLLSAMAASGKQTLPAPVSGALHLDPMFHYTTTITDYPDSTDYTDFPNE